jgi:adenosine deaminase
MARQLPRRMPLAELHCHLGSAVTPAVMWGIAHEQGIKLPTKDYWQFRQMITASLSRGHSFNGYLGLILAPGS